MLIYAHSSTQSRHKAKSVDVCDQARKAQMLQVPLQLLFNGSRIWSTAKSLDFLPENPQSYRSLERLLQDGQLKTFELDAGLKKFRLAHRLASSLSHLYLGPWLQHDLTAKDIFVFQDETLDFADIIDEPYVHCLLQKDQEHTNPVVDAFKSCDSEPYCTFFLSFAQLLIDIAKGETNPGSSRNDPEPWFSELRTEVSKNFQDEMMSSYRRAIKGCMFFLAHYNSEDI